MISQVSKAAFKDSPPAYDYRDVGVTLTDAAIGASYLSPNRSLRYDNHRPSPESYGG
jgi:hypothetical protein